ncbi:MAG TPA: hypothetical protein VIZ00_13125 [Streptosporangiaceae bacterium]
MNAAIPAKRIVPESGRAPDHSGARPAAPEPPTQPLPPFGGGHGPAAESASDASDRRDGGSVPRGHRGRLARSPDGVVAGTRSPASSRRMRGLLVTPWFAAGAGFVIAAALSLNAPRTFLTYRPNDRPNTAKCATCVAPESVPTSKPGVQIRSVNPAVIGGLGAAAGPVVPIHLGPEQNGVSSVTITLPAGQARTGWRLRFELPGRSVMAVLGAQWWPDATDDGGMAVRPAAGGYVSPTDPAGVSFKVSVSGAPVAPVGCVLNGKPCRFR